MPRTVASRPYRGEEDLPRLRAFLVAAAADGRYSDYFHVGDLLWQLYQNTVFDPRRHVRLWEDERGALLGFAWFSPPRIVELQIRPDLRESGLLEGPMLAWAQDHHRALVAAGDPPGALEIAAFGDDARLIRFLREQGFAPGDHALLAMRRGLIEPIPAPVLPDGATVRPVAGEGEFAERVAIHREVWHPSKVSQEAYRRLRGAPGYRSDLDLVAVTPDGAFAAYCICWLDPDNRTGEFEPVGTRATYRRQGYGKAVILEGLQRLRSLGATTAIVYSGANEPARRLYESVGFRIVNRVTYYKQGDDYSAVQRR